MRLRRRRLKRRHGLGRRLRRPRRFRLWSRGRGRVGAGGVAAAVGNGSRESLANYRQISHHGLQRRELRLESSSLGALSLRDPAPSQVEVIGVELDVDGLAPAQELRKTLPAL